MHLDSINGPEDLKRLPAEALGELASEVRRVILNRVSRYGGHVGPNLGMVELTIALHYVFNSPVDKIVFDVSHQCYPHKVLTGRKEAFLKEELFGSVTGYSEPAESVHDHFTMGHTSTAVSMACGMAKARDLMGRKEKVIAVVGDGSLSGGETYEGLSCGAKLHSNLIIVLNDNCHSIANVNGGLYTHLAELRDSNGESGNNIFKALGYEYVYVAEGHNVIKLIETFRAIRDADHPVVVHVHTRKGNGYGPAMANREEWHWFPPFFEESGAKRHPRTGENYDDLVAEYLLDKIKTNPALVLLVAGVPLTIGFDKQRRAAAGRQFIDVDIAEEHMISMAAGIAKNGGRPVVATFSTFFQRAYDQMAQDVCLNRLPVTFLIRNGSVWAGNDVTHVGWFDLSLFSNIPNLVFLCPTNCEEYFAMLDWSIGQREHPVAIRIPRNGVHHAAHQVERDYSQINRFQKTREGSGVAVLALGDFYQLGEEVVAAISRELKLEATLINPRYATGLDREMLETLKGTHQVVVTLEDGIVEGGFGQKVASFYGDSEMKVLNYGLRKEFKDGYQAAELLSAWGISCPRIINDLTKAMRL